MQTPQDPNQNRPPGPPPPSQPLDPPKVRQAKNFLTEYWEAVRSVTVSPLQFFEYMPTEGGMAAPSQFLAVSLVGYCIVSIAFSHDILMSIRETLTAVVLIVVMTFMVEWILKQFRGRGTFEGTFRVIAYSSAPLILAGCPLAAPVAFLYMAVLWWFGFKKVHGIGY